MLQTFATPPLLSGSLGVPGSPDFLLKNKFNRFVRFELSLSNLIMPVPRSLLQDSAFLDSFESLRHQKATPSAPVHFRAHGLVVCADGLGHLVPRGERRRPHVTAGALLCSLLLGYVFRCDNSRGSSRFNKEGAVRDLTVSSFPARVPEGTNILPDTSTLFETKRALPGVFPVSKAFTLDVVI